MQEGSWIPPISPLIRSRRRNAFGAHFWSAINVTYRLSNARISRNFPCSWTSDHVNCALRLCGARWRSENTSYLTHDQCIHPHARAPELVSWCRVPTQSVRGSWRTSPRCAQSVKNRLLTEREIEKWMATRLQFCLPYLHARAGQGGRLSTITNKQTGDCAFSQCRPWKGSRAPCPLRPIHYWRQPIPHAAAPPPLRGQRGCATRQTCNALTTSPVTRTAFAHVAHVLLESWCPSYLLARGGGSLHLTRRTPAGRVVSAYARAHARAYVRALACAPTHPHIHPLLQEAEEVLSAGVH